MISRKSSAYSAIKRLASSKREGFGAGTSLPAGGSSGVSMSPWFEQNREVPLSYIIWS
jgi:hypothetical protein